MNFRFCLYLCILILNHGLTIMSSCSIITENTKCCSLLFKHLLGCIFAWQLWCKNAYYLTGIKTILVFVLLSGCTNSGSSGSKGKLFNREKYNFLYVFIQILCPEKDVSWLVVLFYGVSTLFRSFNTELNFKQFSLV